MKGLSLCGGGVMGAAQAGIIYEAFETDKEFLNYKYPGEYWPIVAGTSIGAINGLMIALKFTAREMYDVWFNIKKSDIMKFNWKIWNSIYNRAPMINFLSTFIYNKLCVKDIKFSELYAETKVDLICFATVIQTGKALVFGRNYLDISVIDAIMMSSAFPLMFTPIEYKDSKSGKTYQIIDGGVLSNSPVLPLIQAECDDITMLTIGNIDDSFNLNGYITTLKRILEFVTIGNEYMSTAWATYSLKDNLKVYRCECEGIGPFDWDRIPDLIQLGVQAWHFGPIDPNTIISQFTTLRNEKNGIEEKLVLAEEKVEAANGR